jgi:hypothetical protein
MKLSSFVDNVREDCNCCEVKIQHVEGVVENQELWGELRFAYRSHDQLSGS